MVFLHYRPSKKGEEKVAYCSKANMLRDFFTKPQQGSIFKKMRNVILNMPDDNKDIIEHRSELRNGKYRSVSTNISKKKR